MSTFRFQAAFAASATALLWASTGFAQETPSDPQASERTVNGPTRPDASFTNGGSRCREVPGGGPHDFRGFWGVLGGSSAPWRWSGP